MKEIFTLPIIFYRKFISPDTGLFGFLIKKENSTCPFYPTCSEYSFLSIKKHGVFLGVFYSIKRILSCGPWQEPKIDLVKE